MTELNSWWLTLFSGLIMEGRISLSRHQLAFFCVPSQEFGVSKQGLSSNLKREKEFDEQVLNLIF